MAVAVAVGNRTRLTEILGHNRSRSAGGRGDVAPVRDVQDRNGMPAVIDSGSGCASSSAGAQPIRQRWVEALPDPVRIMQKRAVDELVRGDATASGNSSVSCRHTVGDVTSVNGSCG